VAGTDKSKKVPKNRSPQGGPPHPTHEVAAEQTRESQEKAKARNAEASIRERMVKLGRGNQQAGRQGQR